MSSWGGDERVAGENGEGQEEVEEREEGKKEEEGGEERDDRGKADVVREGDGSSMICSFFT